LADAALDLADRARTRGEDLVMRESLWIAQIQAMEGIKRSDAALMRAAQCWRVSPSSVRASLSRIARREGTSSRRY